MGSFKIENLSFTYPNRVTRTLKDISITIGKGEFVTICGCSGCGKTTLLRLLKSSLTPFGKTEGDIYFNNKTLSSLSIGEQATKIGFVMQNPDNQIVTDKVWHELAFGLESLGVSTPEIRTRVSEMASFFGIGTWFHKNVSELSGGQKQLLNLASVMVMQPSVLILDEPTSQLDPIAAHEFLKTLEKINREIGTTVILTEHRMEDAFSISDRVVVMDDGKIIADTSPKRVGELLKDMKHDMYMALPAPIRISGAVENTFECPLNVREGRIWLEKFSKTHPLDVGAIPEAPPLTENGNTIIEIKDAWFRYKKALPDVIKGLNLTVKKGELFAIVGGNGTGKTTAISLIAGLNKPYRGEVFIDGKNLEKIHNLYGKVLGVLPQNPQTIFIGKTVYIDLMEILSETNLTKQEKEEKINDIAGLCHIDNLLNSHPYDLSGGEQQRVALAKILLQNPQILLLDEPTKGMDAQFKKEFADILNNLKKNGVTVVMVSHDIEFCAEYADKCALMFDGSITSSGTPRKFFAGNTFYTTLANRMARTCLPNAILAEDIILACGGTLPEKPKNNINKDKSNHNEEKIKVVSLQKELSIENICQPKKERHFTKRTIVALLMIFLTIPLTIYAGIRFLGDRKYYFISFLIILETIIPFCMVFESRKPAARELVIISVLCAIAVAGRTVFFMLPQFKPVVALVIISGICFGGETGFLVGTVTGFVSNFFFGQGPWAPWQMFALGIIGYIAGVAFGKRILKRTKVSLCVFGFLTTFIIYGGIMNPASVIISQGRVTKEMVLSAYIAGIPLDLIHSLSTVIFLWFIAEPMIDKLERVKMKYGLIER